MKKILLLFLSMMLIGCKTKDIQPSYLGDVITLESSRFIYDMSSIMIMKTAESVLIDENFIIAASDFNNNRIEATKNIAGGFCRIEMNFYPSPSGVNVILSAQIPREWGSGKKVPRLILDSLN